MIKKLIQKKLLTQGLAVSRMPKAYRPVREGAYGHYDTPIGRYYLPLETPGDIVAIAMKAGQVFEPEVVEVVRRYAHPGTTILDVGANFGQMSLLFSDIVGRDGEVYSFEAQETVFKILNKNIEKNTKSNIKTFYNAVYSDSGKIFHFPEPDFSRFASYGSYGINIDDTDGPEVSSLKIDDLDFAKPVSFMKVDVQGSDLFAMQGATETISKHKMPILFEYEEQFQEEFGTSFQDYVEFVRDIDYVFKETILGINYLIVPRS